MSAPRSTPRPKLAAICPRLLLLLAAGTGTGLSGCSGEVERGEPFPPLGRIELSVLTQENIYGNGLPPKTVILTYDDGPDEYTWDLAQYLAGEGISVTFFINGRRICKTLADDGSCLEPMDTQPCDDGLEQAPVEDPVYYPESLLQEMVALGHRIANHTTDHCHLAAQDNPESFAFQLQSTQDIVDRHICDGLYLFRAPYGQWDPQAAMLAQDVPALDKLIGPINWDVDGGDWDCFDQGVSVEACGDGYLSILDDRPGQSGIFLLHDRLEFNVGTDNALRLTQYLVPELKAQGYSFTTLDDLLDFEPQGDMACPVDDGMGGMGGSAGAPGSAGMAGSTNGGAPSMGGQGGMGGNAGAPPTMSFGGTAGSGGAVATPVTMPPVVSTPPSAPTMRRSAGGCGLSQATQNQETNNLPSPLWLLLSAIGLHARRRHPSRR